ncbi:MAG: hypothetical protein FWC55_02430 [Firmicutes bacterium]|nr:hypothetical protein [Bacillota bacterium]
MRQTLMERIFRAREEIILFVKRHETACMFAVRLVCGLVLYNVVMGIGTPRPEVAFIVKFPFLAVLLALSFTVLPINASYTLIIALIGVQLSPSLELTAIVTLALLVILLLYTRMAPRESVFILATLAAYYFRLPYLIPILAGLYFSITCVVPITVGVFLWTFIPTVRSLMVTGAQAQPAAIVSADAFSATFAAVKAALLAPANQQWIFTAFIFAMALIVVYAVSRLSFDHSKDIAVGMGALLMFLGAIVSSIVIKTDENLFVVFLTVILSAGLAEAVRFFDAALNYQRAERVEFQDEENYYFVKIIPKVILPRRRRDVRRIRSREDYE